MPAQNPRVLTANRLRTGEVLYWKAGGWVETLAQAEIFADDAAANAALVQAQAFVAANQVVSPYLFDIRTDKGALRPAKAREVVRSLGPSVRPDTGKQSSHVQI